MPAKGKTGAVRRRAAAHDFRQDMRNAGENRVLEVSIIIDGGVSVVASRHGRNCRLENVGMLARHSHGAHFTTEKHECKNIFQDELREAILAMRKREEGKRWPMRTCRR